MKRVTALGALLFSTCIAQAEPLRFSITGRIPAADGGWDFAAVDSASNRLFVARSNGVTAVDLATGKVTDRLVEGARVHGVLPLKDSPFVISTNGASANAFIFDKKTGSIEATLAAGENPDALLQEPKTGLVVIFNGKSHDATLVDPTTKAVVGTIALDGKPEIPAADGNGRIFVNLEDTAKIAVIDIETRKVVGSYDLPGCLAPTGLAHDAAAGVLISACDNKVAKVLEASTGRDLATLAIGKGPDGVLLDAARRRAFIPAADGALTVLSLAGPSIAVVATIETKRGSKTGTLDPASGAVYLPSAEFAPPEKEGGRPTPIPGTFAILVVDETH